MDAFGATRSGVSLVIALAEQKGLGHGYFAVFARYGVGQIAVPDRCYSRRRDAGAADDRAPPLRVRADRRSQPLRGLRDRLHTERSEEPVAQSQDGTNPPNMWCAKVFNGRYMLQIFIAACD
jgi:hypothetical protein